MKIKNESILISIDSLLENKMQVIADQKVLFDFELAELLQVSVKELIRKVQSNKDRFPEDFLIKHPVKKDIASHKQIQFAFTLSGIMMAAGLFKTERAIQISIKMVEFICDRTGGMENMMKLIEKSKNI